VLGGAAARLRAEEELQLARQAATRQKNRSTRATRRVNTHQIRARRYFFDPIGDECLLRHAWEIAASGSRVRKSGPAATSRLCCHAPGLPRFSAALRRATSALLSVWYCSKLSVVFAVFLPAPAAAADLAGDLAGDLDSLPSAKSRQGTTTRNRRQLRDDARA
jgi:hypothetical protein